MHKKHMPYELFMSFLVSPVRVDKCKNVSLFQCINKEEGCWTKEQSQVPHLTDNNG